WKRGEASGAGDGPDAVDAEERSDAARRRGCVGGRDLPLPSCAISRENSGHDLRNLTIGELSCFLTSSRFFFFSSFPSQVSRRNRSLRQAVVSRLSSMSGSQHFARHRN